MPRGRSARTWRSSRPRWPAARQTRDARGAQDAPGSRTRTGLREDQAAAALAVLTDGRRVSVINAPAGSGKTWVLAAAGQAWAAAGLGRVIGITPSQSARNTLAAGVPVSYNCAQFLGHLPGQPRCPRPRPAAARRPGPDGRGLHGRHPRPGRRHHPGGRGRRQGDPGRGYPAAAGGGKRRRHVPARRRPRLRPAHRTRSGSAPPGNRPPACGSATATPACWPSTTSTAGSSAASPSR